MVGIGNKNDSVLNKGNVETWKYLANKIGEIEAYRKGRSVLIRFEGNEIYIPSYPKISNVELNREGDLIVPMVPSSWVAQWKANGSNIRVFIVKNGIIALTRGGFLLDWKTYSNIINSDIKENLVNAVEDGKYLLFGELVGPKSLVRLCVKQWREYLDNRELDYLLFDLYDMEKGEFIDLEHVKKHANKHDIRFIPTMWNIDVDELNELLHVFLNKCDGEMWEGFVFKDKKRGKYWDIVEGTKKWRMDATKEFAEYIYQVRYADELAWRIYEVMRKFILEGYLDTPDAKSEVESDVDQLRDEILSVLKKAQTDRGHIEEYEKKAKGLLKQILNVIIAGEIESNKQFKKSSWEAIKIFIKVYLWSQ
ncbi:MAG: RNA ligase family protein [Candidatus Njordarchaeia archaeon]